MASTPDMAPNRSTTGGARRTAAARAGENAELEGGATGEGSAEADLQVQIDQLRTDIKMIGTTLSRLGNEKASEVQGRAKQEYKNLVEAGQHMVSEVSDEFGNVEKQLKDTIREKPITAVLSAMGIGYLIALLTR